MSGAGSTSLTLPERVRARDEDAWRRRLHLYTPLVRHWCGRWGVRGQDAEDVLQEVFQAVASGLKRFRHDRAGDTFRGWLRGITRNKLLEFCRRRSQPEAQDGTDSPTTTRSSWARWRTLPVSPRAAATSS